MPAEQSFEMLFFQSHHVRHSETEDPQGSQRAKAQLVRLSSLPECDERSFQSVESRHDFWSAGKIYICHVC